MKISKIALGLAGLFLVSSTISYAEEAKKTFKDVYVGVGVAKRTFGLDYEGVSDFDPNISLLTGRIGTSINDNFAIELEAYTGLSEYEHREVFAPFADNLVMKESAGATLWGVAKIPFNDKWIGSLRLGWGTVSYETTWDQSNVSSIIKMSEKTNDNGFAGGLGIEYKLNDKLSIRGDYENINVDDLNLKSYAISLATKF